ncbi:MAG: peptide-methionine (S)-S-oxide reductase MsrA [Thermoplasmata archaeon]|jgi:peptide-methionine (S)-S-oxide reductase|nr:peptide-methionine (S)-S-oxide reductase MsrA [Thermoplasmata archaeon]
MTALPDTDQNVRTEQVTIGGGCFWCTEAVFSEVRGVVSVFPGYAGGAVPNPSYEQVCGGRTGHAEVVQVTFRPDELSYHDLLTIFMTTHDPTTLNRQGNDAGPQYRSIILYHSPEQRATAETVLRELGAQKLWKGRIVTELVPLAVFYPAEEYHQRYFERNPYAGYCRMIIAPKVTKFRKQYTDRLRTPPTPSPSH